METLSTDLKNIFESSKSDFYRKLWKNCPQSLSLTMVLKVDELASTPLYKRLYADEKGLVRIVERDGKHFLIRWSVGDIRNNEAGLPAGSVPLLLFTDADDGTMYSLWCYENGSVPYVGDANNLPVSLICAAQFKTDSLVCDFKTLETLIDNDEVPSLTKKIYVIDSKFGDHSLLQKAKGSYDTKFLLSLPEAGILAEVLMDDQERMVIRAQKGVVLESRNGKCVITKTSLSSPLVRYLSGIDCTESDGKFYLA